MTSKASRTHFLFPTVAMLVCHANSGSKYNKPCLTMWYTACIVWYKTLDDRNLARHYNLTGFGVLVTPLSPPAINVFYLQHQMHENEFVGLSQKKWQKDSPRSIYFEVFRPLVQNTLEYSAEVFGPPLI